MIDTLIPNDTFLTDKIKAIEKKLYDISAARQPYLGNWFELNLVDFEFLSAVGAPYSNNFYITVKNFVPSTRFMIGDKFRIMETGDTTWRYFYVTKVDDTNTRITVAGDKNKLLTGAAFIALSYSKYENPIGFPEVMEYTPTFYGFSSMIYSYCLFWMKGGVMYMFLDIMGNSNDWLLYITPATFNVRETGDQFVTIGDGVLGTEFGKAHMDMVGDPLIMAYPMVIGGTDIIGTDFSNTGLKSLDGEIHTQIGDTL